MLLLADEVLVPCSMPQGSTDEAFGIVKVLDKV